MCDGVDCFVSDAILTLDFFILHPSPPFVLVGGESEIPSRCGSVRYIGKSGAQGDESVREALQGLVPNVERDLV